MHHRISSLAISLLIRLTLCLLLSGSIMSLALANNDTIYTWVGGTFGNPNNWTTPGNWNLNNNYPSFQDTANFTGNSSTQTVLFDGNILLLGLNFTGAPYTLTINNGAQLLLSGISSINTSSNGSVSMTNNGRLTFDPNFNAGQATIINNNLLEFGDYASAGHSTITNNGQLKFWKILGVAGGEAGQAHITNTGNSAVISFSGGSNASQSTIINTNNANIAFYDSSNAGTSSITNSNGATLSFYDNSSAAQATIINQGGSLFLSPSSSSISIGSFSDTANTPSNLSLGSTQLSLGNSNSNDDIFGVISGNNNSALIKTGTGTLTLNGINTYTGRTDITNGTLVVGSNPSYSTASIGNSSTKVDYGATLSGFGTIGSLDNFGSVAPGNSNLLGTLRVNGSFTSKTGSTFAVTVESDQNNALDVTGNANLEGGTVAINLPGNIALETPYTLLTTAGQINGRFDNLLQPTFTLIGALDYTSDPHKVLYTLEVAPFVVDAIEGYANQIPALSQAFAWFDEQCQERILGYSSGQTIYYDPYNHVSVDDPTLWLAANTSSAKLSNAGNGFKNSPNQLAIGIEKSANDMLSGVGFAYTNFHTIGFANTVGANTTAKAEASLYQAGFYTRQDYWDWRWGIAANAGLTDDMNTEEFFHEGMTAVRAMGTSHAYKLGVQAETAYTGLDTPSYIKIQPMLGLSYRFVSRNQFMPNDNTITQLGLVIDHSNNISARSQLGAAFEANLEANINLHPFGFIAWEHEFGEDSNAISATLPNISTTLEAQSVTIDRNALVTHLGASLTQHKLWNLAAFYEGRFSQHYHENAAKLAINYSF